MVNPMNGYQHISNWLQQLQHLQVENVQFKNQLADKIRKELSPDVLEQAEYFQNQFLNNDVAISLLRHEVARHAGLQKQEIKLMEGETYMADSRDQLRKDIQNMQLGMERLKHEFKKYIEYSTVS